MGYFQVRYDSRVVNYDRRGFTRLATDVIVECNPVKQEVRCTYSDTFPYEVLSECSKTLAKEMSMALTSKMWGFCNKKFLL